MNGHPTELIKFAISALTAMEREGLPAVGAMSLLDHRRSLFAPVSPSRYFLFGTLRILFAPQ
jgi:hypothetical protein